MQIKERPLPEAPLPTDPESVAAAWPQMDSRLYRDPRTRDRPVDSATNFVWASPAILHQTDCRHDTPRLHCPVPWG